MRNTLILAAAAFALIVPAAAAAPCTTPGDKWRAREPAQLGIDKQKLDEALDWALLRMSTTVSVYRHGCLAGESKLDKLATAGLTFDGWSMTKSVTALIAGRAVTMGLYDPRQPLKQLYPEADEAHGNVLPTHLLSMTAGTHRNWVRDLSPQANRVKDALTLPFDHKPGTYWEYQQSNVSWLLDSVERAVKSPDIQVWAQDNLFTPLGIRKGSWSWDRDWTGHTEGWAHLKMTGSAWARFGQLLLNKGRWGGKQLISKAWVKKMTTPSQKVNRAYGYLTWLNNGRNYELPNVEGRDKGTGKLIPSGPKRMFMFCGMGEQRVFVDPTRDLVIVRLGQRGSLEGDTRASVLTGRGGELDHELVRRVLRSVTDVPYADPGPYPGSDIFLPPLDDGIVGDALDWQWAASGLGILPPTSN